MITKLEHIGFYTLSDTRARNVSSTSQMKRCEIIINEYCNFKCPYCKGLRSDVFSYKKRKEMNLDEIKNVIDIWCKDQPLQNIRISGGEPTYHKNIVEVVEYAKSKGIKRIAISTNGSNSLSLYKQLVDAGCNDFSISLDSYNSDVGDIMAGNIPGAWNKVVSNIRELSELVYVTVGIVIDEKNIENFVKTVEFAASLNVSDIRVIPSSQYNKNLIGIIDIDEKIYSKYPILMYRINNLKVGISVRGIGDEDTTKCPLVIDDSIVAGNKHYPCVIYMREQGDAIGSVNDNMREDRIEWFKTHNSHDDPICRRNCLDVCIEYNNKCMKTNIFV